MPCSTRSACSAASPVSGATAPAVGGPARRPGRVVAQRRRRSAAQPAKIQGLLDALRPLLGIGGAPGDPIELADGVLLTVSAAGTGGPAGAERGRRRLGRAGGTGGRLAAGVARRPRRRARPVRPAVELGVHAGLDGRRRRPPGRPRRPGIDRHRPVPAPDDRCRHPARAVRRPRLAGCRRGSRPCRSCSTAWPRCPVRSARSSPASATRWPCARASPAAFDGDPADRVGGRSRRRPHRGRAVDRRHRPVDARPADRRPRAGSGQRHDHGRRAHAPRPATSRWPGTRRPAS